jgi:Rad3-related DNA helicase
MELSKFIEIAVTERFAKQALKLSMPNINTQPQAFNWVRDVYEPKLVSHLKHAEKMLEKYVGLKEKIKEFSNVARRYELLDKHACKLRRFLKIYNKENWIVNIVPAIDGAGRRLEFKPVDVSLYTKDMLFKHGAKVLMMSATILDKEGFCELLGIKQSEVSFISIPSPFPAANKPILISPVGKMSASHIDNTLPVLASAVKEILKVHSREKGIIHCHSYKIANYLKRNLRSSRILIHDSSNREQVLKKHIASSKPTVLLSPSMTEGVDLKDDTGRFQIICKVPYPYLGDKLIKKKMYKWKWWYPLQTAKSIVQAVGRSVRSVNDHAVTYILDADWNTFYYRNKNMFPEDFRKCLK